MTPMDMTASARTAVIMWSLFALLMMLIAGCITFRQKRYKLTLAIAPFAVIAFLITAFLSLLWEPARGRTVPETYLKLLSKPLSGYLWMEGALTVIAFFAAVHAVAWGRRHIKPASFADAFDMVNTGICYYDARGCSILISEPMRALYANLLGSPAFDGRKLRAFVEENNVRTTPDGRTYRFTVRERRDIRGFDALTEIIADDVTELTEKTLLLEKETENLRCLKAQLTDQSLNAEEIARSEQTLRIKMQLHDGMNLRLLSAVRAAGEGVSEEERRNVLREWQNTALMLRVDVGGQTMRNTINDIRAEASLIGIEPVFDGVPDTEDETGCYLFGRCTAEAMVNAAKHAGAEHLNISVTNRRADYTIIYTNDGAQPETERRPGGGLMNLKKRVTEAGGAMEVIWTPEFRLIVTLPKNIAPAEENK